jgi:hypothetical protein
MKSKGDSDFMTMQSMSDYDGPRPQFFIVGAPKCGTTAMCHYLSQHPEIFISTPKEPHFFDTELFKVNAQLSSYHYLVITRTFLRVGSSI